MSAFLVLDQEHLKTAAFFAAQSVSSSIDQYARRRQTDPRQIQHQIEIGKIGEFGVYQWLTENDLYPTIPDTTIYDARHKTFAPDMMLEGMPIHVKAQDAQSAARFGMSWTFQYGAKVGSDKEIFAPDPKGYVVFALVDRNTVNIHGAVRVATLHEQNLFRDPKLAKLRGIKTVVYYEDLERLPGEVLWALMADKFKNLVQPTIHVDEA